MQSSPQKASTNAASSSSSHSFNPVDKTRRWPQAFIGGSSSNVISSSPSRKSSDSSTNSDMRQAKATYSLSRGARESALRPSSSGTVGTVGSFKSAQGSASKTSSPYLGKSSLSKSRSSISSSSNRTYHDPMTKEKDFESMLASGETRKLSETAELAKSDSVQSFTSIEQHSSPLNKSGKRRQVSDIPEALEVHARHEDEDNMQRTPTLEARSFRSKMASSDLNRPPRSADRSPSSSFSTLPSFKSNISSISTLGVSSSSSSKELPVHPHHRNDGGHTDTQQSNSQRLNSNQAPVPPVKSTKQTLGPSSSYVSSAASGQSSMRSKTSHQAPIAASPAFSNTSQATFTGPQSKSDPIAPVTQHLRFEGGQSNVSLSDKSSSVLKQKLKKTGGFLKRLGGGSSAEKSQFSPPKTSKIVRRPSQSSIGSEGGVSIANSTKSAPGEYQSRWNRESKVPVPSIPTRFKGSITKSTQGKGVEPLPSGLPASNSAESQASSDGKGRRGNQTPSSTSGSVGSATTEIRHALKAWENEMDATLKQSGQDLEAKTKIEKPLPNWGPTPQLPEYRLNRKASFMDEGDDTKGETEMLHSSSPDAFKYGQLGQSSYDSNFLLPRQPQRAASLGIGLPSTVTPQKSIIHSDPISSKAISSPIHSGGEESDLQARQRREDNMSYASTRSYQTAIDRPSYFVRHAARDEPSVVENGVQVMSEAKTEDEDEEMDPEKSIRLITHGSVDTDDGATIVQRSDATHAPLLAVIEETYGGHSKEKTVTQDDIIRRSPSPSPLIDGVNVLQGKEDLSVDQSAEMAARDLALKCWNEDETFKRKEKIAEWLGGTSLIQQLARKHYMDQFDFTSLRIDAAFRKLCDKLFLRAETQQVDRILSAFSQRFFDCNPQSILVNSDVVHALVFSVLLLNTDLHVAEIQDRMTRSQFVRNTLAAILESVDIAPTQTWMNGEIIQEDDVTSRSSLNVSNDDAAAAPELHVAPRPVTPSARLTPNRRVSNDGISIAASDTIRSADDSPLRVPFSKAWEVEMEVLLREIYSSVKTDQIQLPITDTNSLTSFTPRKPLRTGTDRVNALKRGSIRGIQGLLGNNALLVRSDESLNVSRSSLNSTQRSFSDYNGTPSTSLTSGSSKGPPPTLGFANTLSQSIIKEAKDEDDSKSITSVNDDFTDDELALMGPPWAKEGMLTRKHYWEAPLKRAKDKNWTECFVVVQKGMFSMFRFGDSASNSGNNGIKPATGPNVEMGGGNWLSNATCIGEFSLAHSLANSLPPPGYNRSRPHVFALTLPNGNVFFFQTGHEELVQEWVSTCNYWAARHSREPLAGGVSNMEYGWNKVLPSDVREDDDGHSHVDSISPARRTSTYNSNSDARSVRSGKSGKSLRMRVTNNSMFQSWQSGADKASGFSSPIPSIRGPPSIFSTPDRPFFINEWRAPAPPTVSSTLTEEDQLEACKRHKARVEAELTQHNTLRQPMLDYFASCNPPMPASSTSKAIANFDRKASYLLSDLTKFTLYTATLASANKLKLEKRDQRQLQRMMLKADEESSRVREEDEGPLLKV
jgi:hypothetical protein